MRERRSREIHWSVNIRRMAFTISQDLVMEEQPLKTFTATSMSSHGHNGLARADRWQEVVQDNKSRRWRSIILTMAILTRLAEEVLLVIIQGNTRFTRMTRNTDNKIYRI